MALGFGANARLIAAYETTYGIPWQMAIIALASLATGSRRASS